MKGCLLIFIVALAHEVVCQSVENHTTPGLRQADSLYAASDWPAAIRAYEKFLKQAPAHPVAWNRLGISYQNTKDHPRALASFATSLRHDPDSASRQVSYSRMAMIQAVQNEIDKSFDNLEKAISNGYMLAGELESHQDFANLRKESRFSDMIKKATDNAMPCRRRSQLREFDFWLGEWDVYNKSSGRLAGVNKIEIASGGCIILENWTSKGLVPFTGKSMNYISPVTGKWEQLWIGSDGVHRNNPQMFVNGAYSDGAMRFEFEQWSDDGKRQTGRFIFYNEGPDQVRQFNEVSSDGGKTWITVYDLEYRRKKKNDDASTNP